MRARSRRRRSFRGVSVCCHHQDRAEPRAPRPLVSSQPHPGGAASRVVVITPSALVGRHASRVRWPLARRAPPPPVGSSLAEPDCGCALFSQRGGADSEHPFLFPPHPTPPTFPLLFHPPLDDHAADRPLPPNPVRPSRTRPTRGSTTAALAALEWPHRRQSDAVYVPHHAEARLGGSTRATVTPPAVDDRDGTGAAQLARQGERARIVGASVAAPPLAPLGPVGRVSRGRCGAGGTSDGRAASATTYTAAVCPYRDVTLEGGATASRLQARLSDR